MRLFFKKKKSFLKSEQKEREWAAGQRCGEGGTATEGKGGHACPSRQRCEVSKVIFPEVRCRWENSEKQSEPGSSKRGMKGLQQRGLGEAGILNL